MKLIEQFLNRIPELRLPKGFASLKASAYFEGFNWDELYNRKMKSPYIPVKSKKQDNIVDQGKSLLSAIYNEKRKQSSTPRESTIPKWDEEF